jgi:glycosyltransferase involved in cell wall biosynthesis
MTSISLSVVVPVHDEAESVAALHSEISSVMAEQGTAWELIFVDDGSTDATFERLRLLRAEHPEVRAIRFARNFGKSSALAAGFAAARGAFVITLDGDLQDDPREIPAFLAALDEGFDLICGWKRRRHDPLDKRIASRLFNWGLSAISGLRLHDANCGFKAYRAEVTPNLCLRRGLHRFIPLLAQARGYHVKEIAVAHRPRLHGRSKYGWERVPQAVVDLHVAWLTARQSKRPMLVFGAAAFAMLVPGALFLGFAPPDAPAARWFSVGVGILLILAGAHFLTMAALTRRALAREPEGAAYSIAEQLG